MSQLFSRAPLIDPTHKGPIVNLVGWVTLVVICLAIITVLCSKYYVLRKLKWSDTILTLAVVS